MEQECRTCKEVKPIGDFYLRSKNSAGDKKPNIRCKTCVLKEAKARKARNEESGILSQHSA